jgi:hypothetical protein
MTNLDRVNIVGDDNEVGLLGLDEGDDVVETVLDEEGLLVVLLVSGLVGNLVLGLLEESGLLLLLGPEKRGTSRKEGQEEASR